jgi:hypothetical protein
LEKDKDERERERCVHLVRLIERWFCPLLLKPGFARDRQLPLSTAGCVILVKARLRAKLATFLQP